MKSVALITYNKLPNLNSSDKLLIEPFKKHGFKTVAIPWDKKGVLWENFDLVILRSTWDYHFRIPEFIDWINHLESRKVNLWNPHNIIRWNMNKKYLLDLSSLGIPIIPTLIFNKVTIKNVKEIINRHGWEEIVVKPTYGASAYKIARLKLHELDPKLPQLQSILQDSDVIIQPLIKKVNLEGEYSFIFLNKQYSHSILKRPKKNKYRINRAFGSIELKIKPDYNLLSQAQQVVDKIESPLLYTRIDGLNIEGQLQLMELEVIEPYLFFEKEEQAAEKFVEATISLGGTC